MWQPLFALNYPDDGEPGGDGYAWWGRVRVTEMRLRGEVRRAQCAFRIAGIHASSVCSVEI